MLMIDVGMLTIPREPLHARLCFDQRLTVAQTSSSVESLFPATATLCTIRSSALQIASVIFAASSSRRASCTRKQVSDTRRQSAHR